MQHISDYLKACGEPDMADEVLNAHNRLEAFSEGLDRDSHLAILRAVEYLMAQRDKLEAQLAAANHREQVANESFCEMVKQRDELLAALEQAREALEQAREALKTIANLRNLGKIQPEVMAFETLLAIDAAKKNSSVKSKNLLSAEPGP